MTIRPLGLWIQQEYKTWHPIQFTSFQFCLKKQIGLKKKKKGNTQGHPQGASGQIIKAFRPPMLRIRALVAHVYCTSNGNKRQQ